MIKDAPNHLRTVKNEGVGLIISVTNERIYTFLKSSRYTNSIGI